MTENQNKNNAVFFEITNKCNHRCFHCCKYWEDNSQIRTADKKTLDQIIAIPKSHLTISGGEPGLVKKEFWYLVKNEPREITVNTNLTLWTKEEINYFNKNNNIDLNISVVSLERNNYKEITRADTFDRLLNNLKLINKDNVVSFIVNEKSWPYIRYTTELLVLMGFYKILVSPQTPTPYNSIDTEKVINEVIKLHDEYKNMANITTQGCIGTKYCDHECEAGNGRILIDTKGDIYPCGPIHKPCLLGHLGDDIKEITKKGKEFYYSYPSELQKLCKGYMF